MSSKTRLLLVDDEEKFTANMARLLQFRGFSVSTALDGLSALKALDDDGFDVVVLDVKMPGMGGQQVLKAIKKKSPGTEVIMLTGHGSVESGIDCLREGAFDYLLKPCDIEELVEKINEACEVERIRRRPVLWPRNIVKEITWPSFVKLYARDPIFKALEVFQRGRGMPSKESLYVLDAGDHFKGVVTRRDLLAAAQKEHPGRTFTWRELSENPGLLPRLALSDILRPEYPLATNPEENLSQAAHRMITNNVRCMPVVEGEKVIGFIRLQDILQYMEHEIE